MKKIILILVAFCFCFIARSQSWLIEGNTGTNPSIQYVGTKDDQPLVFRINNKFSGKIDSAMALTFFGFGAGKNTTGYYNVGIGFKCLFQNTTGWSNSGLGVQSLYSNTTGGANTASGSYSLYSNTTGSYNTANGWQALTYNTTGTGNVAVGYNTLYSNNTGSYNTATGSASLPNNTTGSYNTANGWSALYNNTTGSYNTASGVSALATNNTGYENTAFGNWALRLSVGHANTAVGNAALHSNSSGIGNTGLGYAAHGSNQTGSYNTSVGMQTLLSTYTSSYNTAVGFGAGATYNLGSSNTFIGAQSTANANDRFNCIALGAAIIITANNQARIGNSSTTSIGGYANWTNISDGRIKKNIQDNVPGLAFINKLKPVTYNLDLAIADKIIQRPDAKDKDGKVIQPSLFEMDARKQKEQIIYSGFIAQDVEKAAKELNYDFSGVDAAKNDKDLYGLRYAEFVVPLVKAVQEQQELINELIKQNANLQQRINNLEKNSVNNNTSSSNTKEVMSAWPNPSHDIVLINLVAESESRATIKVYDNRGALVKEHRASVVTGNNQVTIDMKALATGTYHFSAEWDNGKMKRTVQVVRY